MYWNEFQWIGPSRRAPGHSAYALVTSAAPEPLTLAQAKKHLRLDTTYEDDQVTNWIKAARMQVENDTETALSAQTWDLSLDRFPSGRDAIVIQKWPLQSVTYVKYTDTAAVLQTWSTTNYLVDTASRPPRIGLTDAGIWPTDVRQFQPGIVRIVVGFATVPEPLLHAMRLVIACFSEEREPSPIERSTYDRLIEPYILATAA